MRSPAALVTLAAVALAAAPAAAADPAPAPAYPMTPAPYFVPYGMVAVPNGPPPFAFVEGRTSNAMRITGLALFGLGSVTTTAGAVVLFASELQQCAIIGFEARATPFQHRRPEAVGVAREGLAQCDDGPGKGAILIAVGALLGVAGVPLFVVGSKAALVPAPAVSVGAGTAELRWSF
jgi:hypothetical protein